MSNSFLPARDVYRDSTYAHVVSLPLPLSNAYLIRGTRSVLIDAGGPGNSQAILKHLSRKGISPHDISLLLLTHGHVDHFGGAWELREQFGMPIAIHRLDADNLRRGRNPELHPIGLLGRVLKPVFQRLTSHPFEPDILLDGAMSLEEFGVEATVIPTLGHTPGSLSIALPTQEWITGDLVSGWPPRERHPVYHLYADSLEQVQHSIQMVIQRKPTIIYPGHGGPFEPSAVRRSFSRDIDFDTMQ